MTTLGGYETTRELHRGGLAAVLLATAANEGAGGPEFAVKVLYIEAWLVEPAQREAIETAFLRAARVQAAAARYGASAPGHAGGHWAPVHGAGRAERGAYRATHRYDGSLQRLIDGRVKLDAPALRLIVVSVLRGLVELRDAKGRRHGNLKPSNILYTCTAKAGGETAIDRVVLTDPAPTSAGATLAGDLRALGETLYQLVMHQSFRSRSGWPAPMGAAWERLGPEGEAWLGLCNRLLDPRLEEQRPSLEGLIEDVERLALPRKKGKRLVYAAAAALLAGSAATGAFFLLRSPPPEPVVVDPGEQFDEEAWARLCTAYYEWFGTLALKLDASAGDAAVRSRFGEDAFLSRISGALRGDVARLNPQVIAESPSTHITTLRSQPPEVVKSGDALRRTREAVAVLDEIEELLSPQGLAEWPLYADASRLAITCEGRGWEGAGEYLRSLTRAIRPSQEFLADAAALLDAAPIIGALDRLERAVVRAEELDDPVLKTLSAAIAKATPPGKRQAELVRDISALDELVRPLSEVLEREWDLLDQELFVESEAHRALAADPTPRTELFSIWLAEARSPRYRQLTETDPRERTQWAAQRQEVVAGVARLVNEFKVDESRAPQEFRARLARIESEISTLEGLKWNAANRAEVMQGSGRVRDELARLTVDVNNAVRAQVAFENQSLEEIRRQLATMENVAPSGSAAIDGVWRRERDRVLAAESTVTALRDRSGALQDLLREIDGQVPVVEPEAGRARDWSAGIMALAQQERERILAGILAAVDWEEGVPAGFSVSSEALAALEAWRAEVSRLAADMGAIEDRLNGLYPLSQRTEAGEASVDEILARWSAGEFLGREDVRNALAPVLGRVEALRQMGASIDRSALLAVAADVGNPARAMAAWRRLGDPEVPWPPVRQSLEDEARLQRLLEGIAGSAPAERRASIRDELGAQAARRWASHMNAVSTPEEIRAAAALRETLKGDHSALSPRALFNLRLHELELTQQETGLPDDDLKQRIEAFRIVAMQLPEVAELDAVRTLTAELGELTSESAGPPPVDVTTLGPGDPALGENVWQGELSPDEQLLTFRRRIGNANLELVFARVDATDAAAPPAFVCTQEATFGLFSAVVGAGSGGGAWQPIRSFMLSWDLTDPRQGPRVWQWNTGRVAAVRPMSPAGNWLVSNPELQPDGANPPYPTGPAFPPPAPTPDHPMQYISPASAVALARLVGCRLPTTAEFQSALALELGGAPLPAYLAERRPNLRDETWALQKRHVDELVQSRRLGAVNSIPPSAGSYWRESPDAYWQGHDDGFLWPAPAVQSSAQRFSHLVGNLAELVFDNPQTLEALPVGSIDTAAIQAALGGGAGDAALGIIGASAQSPPQVAPAQRQPFPSSSMGHSDVGLRLAFSATGSTGRVEPLIARLGRILETPRFVPPG